MSDDRRAQRDLASVCRASASALAADGAAVTMSAATGMSVAHATDETADRLEREQQACGEGPSLSAFVRQAPVLVDDLGGADARRSWPLLAQSVHGVVVGRFLALPVGVGAIKLGTLSIYNRLPGPLLDGQLPTALLAADTAGLAMLGADGEPGKDPDTEHGPVLDYGIHQATGMVMGQTGLPARDALALLRARAFTENVPLQRLATDVIARRITFDPESR